jgi:tRNA A37 threonylcarbamoyladenosine biosynthesis protein TsaE
VVQSPTYAYLNIYDDKLLHIDMDRLQTEQQLFESGIIEAIERYPYVLIEWPKYTELYASDFIFLDIKKVSVTQRIFTLY